jgi:hypothetical protein
MSVRQARKVGAAIQKFLESEQGKAALNKAQILLNEAQVLAQVKEYLAYHGWLVMRIHQSLGSKPGLPDLIALKDGVTIYVECKSQRAGAKLSGPQEIMRQEIERHGGIYVVAKGIEDVERAIRDAC